jgi:hypothetical protein
LHFLVYIFQEVNEGDQAMCVGAVTAKVIEGGDSNRKDESFELGDCPTSKSLGKRAVGNVEGLDSTQVETGEASATKEPKMICL